MLDGDPRTTRKISFTLGVLCNGIWLGVFLYVDRSRGFSLCSHVWGSIYDLHLTVPGSWPTPPYVET